MNFIEIGSNDYDTMLHSRFFCDRSWGIIVEPLAKFMDRLPRYPNVIYLNSAVTANHDGVADFYAPVDNPDPPWVKSVGSLHPDHPTLQTLGIQNQTVKTQVKTISLETLYSHLPDANVHFLKIDTEGNDFELLKNWQFERFLPMHIQFESKLMSQDQLEEIKNLLQYQGYTVTPGTKKDYNATPYNHMATLEI